MAKHRYVKYKDSEKIHIQGQNTEEKSSNILEKGMYTLDWGALPPRINLIPFKNPKGLINISEGIMKDIQKEVLDFFSENTKKVYSELEIPHKMALLLYGRPGIGKTSLALSSCLSLVEKCNAIGLNADGYDINVVKSYISIIRESQNNPIIVFVDEIDSQLDNDEEEWLKFLDGVESFEDVIIIGCTNNYDQIPERFTKRKSRFKNCFEIKSFPTEVYKTYIAKKLPKLDADVLSEFAYKSAEKGLTMDELKHAVIFHRLENKNINQSIALSLKYT